EDGIRDKLVTGVQTCALPIYAFLRWGQSAFRNLAIVPPDTGIVHQVNLEYLARVVFVNETNGRRVAYPDTLVGTDSHTTMINGRSEERRVGKECRSR